MTMASRAKQSSKTLTRKLERAEGGDAKAADELKQAEKSEPEVTEAVEQVAADGPSGRGLAR
jgi:hypothetical protein